MGKVESKKKEKKCCGNCGHAAHKKPLKKKVMGGDNKLITIEICKSTSKG